MKINLLNNLKTATDTTAQLTAEGFDVREIYISAGKPTITLWQNKQCEQLQQSGQAVCYIYHQRNNYRKWQAQINQCRVVWEGGRY